MSKFNVNTFDLDKNYVIEASAGTGKTYNIIEIVRKIVNAKSDLRTHLPLSQILIVTYTEKAAGELKDRIRKALPNEDINNASIYTIHSFCQNTIKEFGLSANLPLNLNVINANEVNNFYERYIREGSILQDVSLLFSAKIFVKTNNLQKLLVDGINKYYLDFDGKEDQSIVSLKRISNDREFIDRLLLLKTSKTMEQVCDNDNEINYFYNVLISSSVPKVYEFAQALALTYNDLFNFDGKKFKSTIKEFKQGDEVEEAFKFFKCLKDDLSKNSIEKILTSIYLKDFYLKWQKEKELNKNQTFDDMIRYVRESILKDNKLKNKLKEKYTLAIIDEFQDTNQKQFDIFKSIFMEDDNHKIIVVGDPKQSIYSFQGADVEVYRNAIDNIKDNGGEICMLSKNYRSTAAMVNSCNKLFEHYNFSDTKFESCGYLNENDNDENIKEAKYEGQDIKAFWIAQNEEAKEINEFEFANIAVQQIIDCCTRDNKGKTKLQVKNSDKESFRNVTFKDFAILARTSSEMFAIENALKNTGIPYLRYKDNSLFFGKECVHWINVLKAISLLDFTGRNRKILKRALFTNFFGLSLEKINSEYVNKDDIKEVELFNKWRIMASNYKWEDLFDDIIISSGITDRMTSLKDIQSLANYKQIASFCIEYLSKGKSLDDLIRNLENLSKKGKSEDDDPNGSIVEKSTNFDCVQIMTIHASKGLQFPVVIAVGGFKQHSAQLEKLYKYHKVDSLGKTKQQVLDFNTCKEVKEERIAEWKRLFYVAYTRAQFLLILPYYKSVCDPFLKESIDEYMKSNPGLYRIIYNNSLNYSQLRRLSNEILKPADEDLENLTLQHEQNLLLKSLIKMSHQKKTYKNSYSSLTHHKTFVEEIDEFENPNKEGVMEEGLSIFDKSGIQINCNYNKDVEPIVLASDFPMGPKLGTALHEIFENLDFQDYENNLEEKIIKCFLKQGIKAKEEWIDSCKNIVYNVLNASLPIINGVKQVNGNLQLKTISINNKLDEVEFNFNLFDQKLKNYFNGFVDMIFRHKEYYAIVDWKSDRLNDSFDSFATKDSLKQHVDDCYSIQRVLYSYCLIKWLKLQMSDLTEKEIFEKHFGGIYYIFLRGCKENLGNGVYCQTWNSWEDLEQSFKEIVKSRLGGISNE